MIPQRIIWRDGRRRYYYQTYLKGEHAYQVAQRFKKKNKSRYYIIKQKYKFGNRYHLYLTKATKLY